MPGPEIKEPDRRESQNGQDNPTNPHKKAEGKKKNCKTHNKGKAGCNAARPGTMMCHRPYAAPPIRRAAREISTIKSRFLGLLTIIIPYERISPTAIC